MVDKILKWLGLEKKTEYEKLYFDRANTKASIYMCAVVCLLEIWMIIRTFGVIVQGTRSTAWIVMHMAAYVLLFAAAVIVWVYSVCFLNGKTQNRKLGIWLRIGFSLICVVFGMAISQHDYAKGEQMLTFVTMVIFAGCIYAWKPIVSFAFLTFSFGVFFLIIDNSLLDLPFFTAFAATSATKINLFIMWISVLMVSLSMYFQRLEEAHNSEDVKNANEHLRLVAETDLLTGLSSKRYFMECSKHKLSEESEDMVFLFLNITNFKGYNEKYGYASGNELLKKTAAEIREVFKDDICSRFSDDHFALLTAWNGAKEKAELLRKTVSDFDDEITLDLKCGAFKAENKDCDPVSACDNARYACDSLKKHSSEHFCEFDPEMEFELRRRRYIINNIDKAIENGYIKAYYQPVVWSENKHICGAEALARWDDPEFGFLSPAAFIPVLEEYHQIHKLDAAIVDIACADIRKRLDSGLMSVPVSVNFSRLDFELTDVLATLENATKKYGISSQYLHVEITETTLNKNSDSLNDTIRRIKEKGYPIWLDDFGSGYSSLNVLKDFEFDVIKLDMQFLSNFSNNKKSGIIIDYILKMAEQIGIHTLSEGVETVEEADFLRSAGCEKLQGYLIGKPMPIDELYKKIDEGGYTISEEYLL